MICQRKSRIITSRQGNGVAEVVVDTADIGCREELVYLKKAGGGETAITSVVEQKERCKSRAKSYPDSNGATIRKPKCTICNAPSMFALEFSAHLRGHLARSCEMRSSSSSKRKSKAAKRIKNMTIIEEEDDKVQIIS